MSWRKVRLDEVCRIEKGSVGIQKAIPGEYPMVVTGEERKSHNEFQFDDEAVIIPLVSGTGHGHASMKRIHFQKGKFALGSILCAVIPKNRNEVNAEYLYRYLDLNKENELVARMKGMANVSLPIKEIALIEIPLPPFEEQLHFVEKYKKLEIGSNLLSTELTYDLSLVSQLRQSFLREAMQGKLLPQNPSDGHAQDLLATIKSEKAKLGIKEKPLQPIKPEDIPFEIPGNWAWSRLGELITLVSGQDLTPFDYSDIDSSGIPYITGASNLENGNIIINRWTKKPKALAYNFDLLLTCKGSGVGKMALLKEPKVHIARQIMAIRSSIVLIEYLMIIISLKGESYKSSAKSLIPGIDRNIVLSTEIPLPPLAEQHRIVAKLDQLMQTCDALAASIKQSKEQNEKLLQQVLREALNND